MLICDVACDSLAGEELGSNRWQVLTANGSPASEALRVSESTSLGLKISSFLNYAKVQQTYLNRSASFYRILAYARFFWSTFAKIIIIRCQFYLILAAFHKTANLIHFQK